MRNDVEPATPPAEAEPRTAPLLILAADEDLACVDDLCLPAEGRGAKGDDIAEVHPQ